MEKFLPVFIILLLLSGCITRNEPGTDIPAVTTTTVLATETPVVVATYPSVVDDVSQEISPSGPEEISFLSEEENLSVPVEVDYRKYVDWFKIHNFRIRAYTPEEYICGQYTVDMIKDSEEAGFKAYFASVTFTDGTGHALVSFYSNRFGTLSWNFFEPQTNNYMSVEVLDNELNRAMGKKVKEVNIYGYFDNADDSDPSTWRFAYPLFNKKY